MFVAGLSAFDAGAFGFLSMCVAIFSAIKVFTWVASLYKGEITFTTPMLYFFWFLFLFTFGGMTGVAVATNSLDVHWHDTYFVVAHFHFIMVGGSLTAFLGAAHYWFPKMFGKLYNERFATVGALGVFIGFNLTFVPQFLLGNMGMPRRYYSYPSEFQSLNVASTAGATLLAFGFTLILIYLAWTLIAGPKAEKNPWESRGFEWRSESPPPTENFHDQQTYDGPPHAYQGEDSHGG
jgi:cytochrome c oxidase subunit 1